MENKNIKHIRLSKYDTYDNIGIEIQCDDKVVSDYDKNEYIQDLFGIYNILICIKRKKCGEIGLDSDSFKYFHKDKRSSLVPIDLDMCFKDKECRVDINFINSDDSDDSNDNYISHFYNYNINSLKDLNPFYNLLVKEMTDYDDNIEIFIYTTIEGSQEHLINQKLDKIINKL